MNRLPKHITLKHLHAFIAVAQEGGFTAAGRRLRQTQSSVTGLIQQMEQSLGCQLFERTSRSVVLTQVGQEFLPRAITVLKEFEGAVDDVIRYGALERGQVTITAAPSAVTEILAPVVKEFSLQYPGIRINLHDSNSRLIQASVSNREADFGLTSRWVEDPVLLFQPCLTDQFGLLYPSAEPWPTREERLQWRRLIGRKQIGLVDETGILSILRGRIDLPRDVTAPFYEASSTTSQAALVRSGMGVAVLPALAAHRVLSEGLSYTLLEEPTVKRTLCLITHAHYALTPMAQALFDMVRDCIRHLELPMGCEHVTA
ncbi:LysR family transcriptional regulator [Parapusillimonas granuli]|uniref:LysR family transcriptional regulator n=1 Tax=Parapusillimonas granuli TaxID=380911 RepID=A0A853G708_9BURK|nr:LysR family transcriptional regulator [Parapusillimonas granuli]MBB5214030.1 DNA-binding transcriptional LysR family regulator [Parapusillimonas granuli]MEB2400879.1 LysR family transcriptional regulator [Alcaligenaceae bacterium]NYT50451.1 LysR family transcriptional regulator [Parapusillimonas granuli]